MPEAAPGHRFVIPKPAPGGRIRRVLRFVLFFVLTGSAAGCAIGLGTYLYFAPTVPHFGALEDYQPKIGTKIYSAGDQLIGEFAEERRVLVPFERIPPQLFNAFIAAEDKRFYRHIGVDILGVGQAIFDKIRRPGSKLRGASTITQQVAKSLLASRESWASASERKLSRKIREAILAYRLERRLGKNDILYMYASQIFLGHKAYGVQAAAEHYFRKNVWELSLAEMATIAGLPQRPSDYSPFSRPKAAKNRRGYVLGRMLVDGYITQEEHDRAVVEDIDVFPRRELYLQIAPYFTEQVRRELVERYGDRAILEDGLRVFTTVNIPHQHYAQRAISRGLYALDQRQGYRGPLTHIPAEKRALFIAEHRSSLDLNDDGSVLEPERGKVYVALVTGFTPKGSVAMINVAGLEGLLPLAGMIWARDPNPVERIDFHYVKDTRHILEIGDVIAVKKTTRADLFNDRYASKAMNTVPKDKDAKLFRLAQEPIAQAALMAVDARTGYVRAQVGGYNFEDSSFNRATQACREPGSAFKPIVYSAAIDKLDYTASTLVDDKPLIFDDEDNEARWKPNNAGMEFRGSLPLRTCLMDSINIPAIRIAEAVGITDLIQNAENLGLTTPLKRELGTAIGSSCTTLEALLTAYTTLNQYGKRRDLHFIRRVVDRYGNVLEDHSDPADPMLTFADRLDRGYAKLVNPRKRALDAPTAFLTISLMKNVIKNGTGMGASRLGWHLAGKTGTTNDSYDAWFLAFTRNVVAGAWVGHDQKERPLGVSEQGGRTALPIWVDFMVNAMRDHTVDPPKRIIEPDFPPPFGVIRASIDPVTGRLARPNAQHSVVEWYRQGSEPTDYAPDKAVFEPGEYTPWEIDPG